MLDFARTALECMRGRTREEFLADVTLRHATAMLLQQIGEAAQRVSPALRAEHPETPWEKIVGLRHRIVHDYLRINFHRVWEIASEDVPPLIEQLRVIVDELGGEPED